jgi:biotin synthase
MGMEVCCTLGMIEKQQAEELKKAGLTAYNHNLDTSREYYPNIITTRSYDDRLQTLQHVREAGISICSGDSSKLLMFLAFIRGLRTTLHKAILFQLTKNWAIYVFDSSVYNMVLHLFFFSGGIIGLGEAEEDRVGLLHTLATLPTHPESVPINALVAVKGTPLEDQKVFVLPIILYSV